MHAILLFSATLHIAAIGLLAAFVLRYRQESQHADDPSLPQLTIAAATLAAAVFVVTMLLMTIARGFDPALITGLIAGVLAAVAFLLGLGAWPAIPAEGQAPSRASVIVRQVFVGTFAALEVLAFCFLAAGVGMLGPYA